MPCAPSCRYEATGEMDRRTRTPVDVLTSKRGVEKRPRNGQIARVVSVMRARRYAMWRLGALWACICIFSLQHVTDAQLAWTSIYVDGESTCTYIE